jgi:hypothetical protein
MQRSHLGGLRVAAALTVLVVPDIGCTSTGQSASLGPRAGAGFDPVLPSHVLTQRELAMAQGPTAYDAIRMLRPLYLRTRGAREAPAVIVNFTARGTVDDLRHIPITHVREIRFLPGPAATVQYGPGHTSGVIVVLTC